MATLGHRSYVTSYVTRSVTSYVKSYLTKTWQVIFSSCLAVVSCDIYHVHKPGKQDWIQPVRMQTKTASESNCSTSAQAKNDCKPT